MCILITLLYVMHYYLNGIEAIELSGDRFLGNATKILRRETNLVPFFLGSDLSPFFTVAIGSNRQLFRMFLHIGAPITWVAAKDSDIPNWETREKFDPKESVTGHQLRKFFDYNYGVCHVVGNIVRDTLAIGRIDLERIQFGLITNALNSHLLTGDADGFLGLGPQALRTNFERTFMDYMADQKLFGCRRFGFIFNDGVEGAGYIAFGSDVETHIKGELIFVDSTSVTNWQTELTKIMVGDHTVYVGARATLFDTLYKSVVLPSEVAKKINELLEPTDSIGPFTVMDCEMKQDLPDITFAFGSTQLVLKSHQYLARIKKDGRDYCVSIFAEADPTAFPFAIMGMSFISKFDTLFDLDLMRIGFASLGR